MSQFVVRPGETDFDAQDRIQGALDLPMNASGRAQVGELAEALRTADLDYIYTSASEPSFTTAQILGKQLQVAVKVLDDLANCDLGLWEGLSRSEIRHKQSRAYRQWEEAPESVCPPCGEQPEEVQARIERALRKPLRRGGSFAIVASDPLASLIQRHLNRTMRVPHGPSIAPGTCCRIDEMATEHAIH